MTRETAILQWVDLMADKREAEVYEMLVTVVRSLVDNPDDVTIHVSSDEVSTVFTLDAPPSELGKLIGAHGRTARALRVILGANGAKLKRSLRLDIARPQPQP